MLFLKNCKWRTTGFNIQMIKWNNLFVCGEGAGHMTEYHPMAREQERLSEWVHISLKGPSPVHCVFWWRFKGLMLHKRSAVFFQKEKKAETHTQTHVYRHPTTTTTKDQEGTRQREQRRNSKREDGGKQWRDGGGCHRWVCHKYYPHILMSSLTWQEAVN